MSKNTLFVPARYYMRLADLVAERGFEIAPLLRTLNLPIQSLAEPDAQVSWAQVESLLAKLRILTGRSDLGFELGKLLTVSAHSIVGFGMLNNPNVEDALRFLAQYFSLVMPSFRMQYIAGEDFGELQFSPTTPMSEECLAFHVEAIGMAALREVRDLASDRRFRVQLHIAIPPPPHASRYGLIPDLETEFHAEFGAVVRLRCMVCLHTIPLAAADKNALKVAEEHCRLLVQKIIKVGGFADLIAITLSGASKAPLSEDEVAAMFNISKRTLVRNLQREKTSFRAITRQVLHDTARQRLLVSTMSITQVSYSLGFRDTSNFTRAFRNVEGCSPSEFRRRATSSGFE
ncbi:MAG: AraC family transcriptional regulator ligand-binding domain-containing protein [Stagnimonas sp.]|nr:AraC family transcriptional regulator ligand-binding domain-containing protein [Stagnimonas sp.]